MAQTPNLNRVSDNDLLRQLTEAIRRSRVDEADVVALIGEVDARKLYAREACSSMFDYCRRVFHLSEPETYLRVAVARASRRHPTLLTMLRDGRLHLSGIERLAPHLTPQNREALLKRATHKSKREIEEIVAEVRPRPDVRAGIRKLPERRPQAQPAPTPQLRPDGAPTAAAGLRMDGVRAPCTLASARPTVVEPLAPGRHKVCFTASTELREKLERLQALMRSSESEGDLARVIDVAVTRELERIEAKRFAKTKTPRKALGETDTTPRSRYIPAAVKRVVHERDGGRCTYRDKRGRRCAKRHDLEFHHKRPFGRGGPHSPEVLTLHCKVHNQLMAEQEYGKDVTTRFRRSASPLSEPAGIYWTKDATSTHARSPG